MRTIAQKIRRLVLRMLCCVVAEEFWAHSFFKSTSTYFGGGGLVRLSWSGLANAGEPLAAQPIPLMFFLSVH
jgi:hypothetical protein